MPLGHRDCKSAARKGQLETLKYAHEHGCPWDKKTCWAAADGGDLEVLKYLHEHECPWDKVTYWAAAEGGHLEVLKYAHENGCPGWNENLYHELCDIVERRLRSRNTKYQKNRVSAEKKEVYKGILLYVKDTHNQSISISYY